jgi:hypothetical protein
MCTHGSNLDQNYQYNNAPSTYVWEVKGRNIADRALRIDGNAAYDQTTWGGNVMSTKTGWSNDSALQVNYQRPFRRGLATRSSMCTHELSESAAIRSVTI